MRANARIYRLPSTYLYQHNTRYFGRSALSWAVRSGDLAGARNAVEAGAWGKGSQLFDSELLHLAINFGNEEIVGLFLESYMRSGPNRLLLLISECGRESDSEGESEVEDQGKGGDKDKQQYRFHRGSSLAMALMHDNEAVVRVLIKHIKTSLEQKGRVSTQFHISENDETPLQQLHRLGIILKSTGHENCSKCSCRRQSCHCEVIQRALPSRIIQQ